jgi:hypothetical protein
MCLPASRPVLLQCVFTCLVCLLLQCGLEPHQSIPASPVQAQLCVQVCGMAGGITGGHQWAHERAAPYATWPYGQPATLLVVLLLLQVGCVAGQGLHVATH